MKDIAAAAFMGLNRPYSDIVHAGGFPVALQNQLGLLLQKESSTAAAMGAGISCTVDEHAVVKGFTFEDAIAILAGSCIIFGLIATSVDMLTDPHEMGCWYRLMEKSIGYVTWERGLLISSVVTATVLDWIDLVTDILVVVGYAICGAWVWFTLGVVILVFSTVYIAHNAMRNESSKVHSNARFLLAMLQLDLVIEGWASVRDGRKSIHFARSKFLEGLCESCPQAFLSIYVLYAMHAQSHIWLILSTLVSIISLAYGLSEWLEIGVDERIFLHTYWYHHCVRTCFFVVDFSLRLLTVTLLLQEAEYRWGAFLLLATVVFMYVIVMSFFTRQPSTLMKALSLTFFVNIVPAELRKREGRERFLFLLDPELRKNLYSPILLARMFDFLLLSGVVVYIDGGRHPRRALTLGLLLLADILLVWCVRMVTTRLEEQHELLRRNSTDKSYGSVDIE
jgi:hypothetical protein